MRAKPLVALLYPFGFNGNNPISWPERSLPASRDTIGVSTTPCPTRSGALIPGDNYGGSLQLNEDSPGETPQRQLEHPPFHPTQTPETRRSSPTSTGTRKMLILSWTLRESR